ncbi:thioredoxin domain-containing protein 3 [Sigmodon hispidus]
MQSLYFTESFNFKVCAASRKEKYLLKKLSSKGKAYTLDLLGKKAQQAPCHPPPGPDPAVQSIINSQTLWDEMLLNKGLTVIDVYQAWCGPCKAVQALFRKLKNELNEDEILHFAVAEADNIVTLQPFREKCEPVFLFSLNGKIVAKIKGANAPLINKKVINLIEEERKVVAGEMARPQYMEIPLADQSEEDLGEGQYESAGEAYNMAIIKPDAVLRRKNIEIKEKLMEYFVLNDEFETEKGFVIEIQDNMFLPEEVVREFYSHLVDQPDFEEFVSFVISGISCVLIISQGEEQELIQEDIQPQSESEEEEPYDRPEETHVKFAPMMIKKKRDSLEDYLERQHMSEFCDVEDDVSKVSQFVDILFPNFKAMKSMNIQRTLALLMPEVYEESKDDILNTIQNEGFTILMQRQITLSEEEARTVCKNYENEEYFSRLIAYMCSSPSYALVLLRENGVEYWKELIGPKTLEEAFASNPESLCAQFATGNFPINQFYGSSSKAAAEKEIEDFFPPQSTLALIKPHVTQEQRMEILQSIKEAGFEITLLKEMHLTPEHANKVYFKITGKEFYKNVLEVLSSGMSVIMVLTKWNAVAEWRRMIGPVDPEEAKLISPDSLRAKYGIDILRNAVHGSSTISEASMSISNVFTEVNLEDGEEH